jgi:2,3-bisphosphoglycerate-dependent phosphoglycerate mutase
VNLILIRHAESAPSKDINECDWPLSPAGQKQASELISKLAELKINKIISSPYPRAIHTVTPFAEKYCIDITQNHDLRERELSAGMIDNWLEELEKTWIDFDYKLPNGESSNECQARVFQAITNSMIDVGDEVIAISSHGNAISLFLNKVDPKFNFDFWRNLQNPDVFGLKFTNETYEFIGRV